MVGRSSLVVGRSLRAVPYDFAASGRVAVSTIYMPQTKQAIRLVGWAVAGLCLIALILAATIRIDQYLLRRDAERLLSDLKSLEMRTSTYEDARHVIERWSTETRQEGPCQPYWCDVRIFLGVFPLRHRVFFIDDQTLGYVYRFLGGRVAFIEGSIRVRKNVVWGKGIRATIQSYSGHADDGRKYYYTLVGEAGSGSPMAISSLHPEYGVDSWSGCCIDAQVIFTPYTDAADVNRLMDINFSCLTSWHPCETKADILPTAWNESTAEQHSGKTSGRRTCSPDVIRVLSRESKRVVIGEVAKVSGTDAWVCKSRPCAAVPSTELGEVTVLLQGDLKPWNPHFPLASESRSFSHVLPMNEKVGDRFLFFFVHPNVDYRVNQATACAPVPATAENVEAAQHGAAEYWTDHNYEFLSAFPGLGDLKPPAIEFR